MFLKNHITALFSYPLQTCLLAGRGVRELADTLTFSRM